MAGQLREHHPLSHSPDRSPATARRLGPWGGGRLWLLFWGWNARVRGSAGAAPSAHSLSASLPLGPGLSAAQLLL